MGPMLYILWISSLFSIMIAVCESLYGRFFQDLCKSWVCVVFSICVIKSAILFGSISYGKLNLWPKLNVICKSVGISMFVRFLTALGSYIMWCCLMLCSISVSILSWEGRSKRCHSHEELLADREKNLEFHEMKRETAKYVSDMAYVNKLRMVKVCARERRVNFPILAQ